MGFGAKKHVIELSGDVAPAGSETMDTFSLTGFIGYKYLVFMSGNGRTKFLELNVAKENGGASDSISSRLGDSLDVSINVTDDGADVSVTFANSEAFTVSVKLLKFLL